ncbi:CUZ1 CDC48-associated ubiquitin-like/zinc finger protein 1 [Candida maltosa Xu316]
MSSVTNLFIDKSQQPNQDDQGIMNLGRNCQYCNQLDFLPFVCEYCKKTYCQNHRTVEQHECVNKEKFFNQHPRTPSPNSTISSKSLFPDRDADRRKMEAKLNASGVRPTTIKETQFRVGDVAGTNAFKKFQKFLSIQRKSNKKTDGSMSITKLFGKSSLNKFVDIANLKKNAKGDAKIKLEDKIFVWCVYVKNPDEEINIEKDKKPIFVNKNWVIGRSLDSIADALHIKNNNNVTSDSSEKLNIFKIEENGSAEGEPKLIATSLKSNVLKTGDTIYLVRGTI